MEATKIGDNKLPRQKARKDESNSIGTLSNILRLTWYDVLAVVEMFHRSPDASKGDPEPIDDENNPAFADMPILFPSLAFLEP